MKNVDLTPLKDNDVQFEKTINAVSDSFKCNWDDPVHDSYKRYVDQLREYSSQVRNIRCKAETLIKEVDELHINEFESKAGKLCREADSI